MNKIGFALVAALILAGCTGHREQDIDTILESELLLSVGLEITVPNNPYYTFVTLRRDIHIDVALHVLEPV